MWHGFIKAPSVQLLFLLFVYWIYRFECFLLHHFGPQMQKVYLHIIILQPSLIPPAEIHFSLFMILGKIWFVWEPEDDQSVCLSLLWACRVNYYLWSWKCKKTLAHLHFLHSLIRKHRHTNIDKHIVFLCPKKKNS